MTDQSVQAILDFLAKVLPGILLALGLGYTLGSKGLSDAKKDLADEKLKTALANNQIKVDSDNDGLSPSELLAGAVSDGAKLDSSSPALNSGQSDPSGVSTPKSDSNS